ncbi:MAG: GntR family transcriptional regulator [Pseudomonadota bacterium]
MPNQTEKTPPNFSIAVTKLREMIFSSELGPGTDHLETELAQTLGMSRTPVREALLVLEAQGLLTMRPRKGVRISPLSPDDMSEIYDVLTELESLAAADAARAGYNADDLKALTQTISDMDKALAIEDREGWAQADDHFHQELMRLGGNSRAARIVGMMADQVRRARLVTLYMRPLPIKSNEDHTKVLNAIREGEEETARRLHREHRLSAKEMLTTLLQRHRLNKI